MGRAPEPKPAHRFYPNFQIPTFLAPTENTLEGFFIYWILFLISPPKDCGICRFSRSKAALSFRQLENAIRTDFLGVFGGVSDLHQRSDFTESWASQCLWSQRSFGHTDFRLLRYLFFLIVPKLLRIWRFSSSNTLEKAHLGCHSGYIDCDGALQTVLAKKELRDFTKFGYAYHLWTNEHV